MVYMLLFLDVNARSLFVGNIRLKSYRPERFMFHVYDTLQIFNLEGKTESISIR